MKRVLIVFAAAITILAISGVTQAATITYTNSLVSGFDIPNQSVPVSKFNPVLGTLNSVSVAVSVKTYGELGFENKNGVLTNRRIYTYDRFASQPYGPYGTTNGQLGLSFDSQTLASVSWNVANSYLLNLPVFDGTVDYAGPSGYKTTYVDVTDSQSYNYTLAADLAKFTGIGNADFIANGTAWEVIEFPGGNNSYFTKTDGTAEVSVTYDYTIPEPATISMLALGVLGLLKKRKA